MGKDKGCGLTLAEAVGEDSSPEADLAGSILDSTWWMKLTLMQVGRIR